PAAPQRSRGFQPGVHRAPGVNARRGAPAPGPRPNGARGGRPWDRQPRPSWRPPPGTHWPGEGFCQRPTAALTRYGGFRLIAPPADHGLILLFAASLGVLIDLLSSLVVTGGHHRPWAQPAERILSYEI